jgi:ABC-2 type transport system permease protein
VAMAFVPALALATVLVFWGLFEQQSTVISPLMFLLGSLPEAVRGGPKEYRSAVWTMAFNIFFSIETFFSMLLVLTVGPDLVSQDLRFNAMPMYFSRPIRRVDYFLGKLGVIGVFLASVAIAPAVAAYILGVAFSLDVTVIRDTWRLLVGSIAFGLVVVFSAGTLMLAISSMSRNSRLVGAAWVGLWLVSNVSADVLILSARRQWCPLVSYTANLDRLREGLLDTNSARRKFLSLYEAGRETGLQAARAALPFGRRRRFFAPAPPPPPPPPRVFEDDTGPFNPFEDQDVPPLLRTPPRVRQPWTWSAGVLGVLFVLSAWTLTTRVKSMDRLK